MWPIQVVPARALWAALDDSIDRYGEDTMDNLLFWKTVENGETNFNIALDKYGVLDPVCVLVRKDRWMMGNGHHRMAWAIDRDTEIPVVFANANDTCGMLCISAPDEIDECYCGSCDELVTIW